MPVQAVSGISTLSQFVPNVPINKLCALLYAERFMSYSFNKYEFYLSKRTDITKSMKFNFVHFKLRKCYVLEEGFEVNRGFSRWTKQIFVLEKNKVNLTQHN